MLQDPLALRPALPAELKSSLVGLPLGAPVLDILVPHFNDPEGLALSLNSIARQTWRGRGRVIVVDDGSSEEAFARAAAHCEAFRETGPYDLLLLRNERNLGRPATRNRLLDAAKARHVAWLDAGDTWYAGKLRSQFEHLARLINAGEDIDRVWVTCNYDWSQNGTKRRVAQKHRGDQVQALLKGRDLRAYLWTLLGTRRAFRLAGRFDERLPRLQDLDYFLTFLRSGGRIEAPPDERVQCCYHKSDVGRNARDIARCHDLVLAKHRPALLRYPPALSSELVYRGHRLAARFALSNRDRGLAAFYLALAGVRAPLHVALVTSRLMRRRLRVGRPA